MTTDLESQARIMSESCFHIQGKKKKNKYMMLKMKGEKKCFRVYVYKRVMTKLH